MIVSFSLKIKTKIPFASPVLLVDCSPSMKNYRAEIHQTIDSLHFEHQKIFFSDTIYTDKEKQTGKFTNITNALITARNLSPSAIMLISDGNHNFGPSPNDVLNDFKIPIYCFGAGNKNIKDQAIVHLFYPEYSFRNDTVLVEAIVDVDGMGGKIGKISLKAGNIYLEKNFKLTESLTRHSIEFKFVPRKIGDEKCKISLTPQPEEINYNNNNCTFFINVFERKLSLLYYTDYPSFNTIFIANCLKNNINLELSQAIRVSENRFKTTGTIVNQEKFDLNQFNIIIFDNINAREIHQDIKEFIHNGKGILITGIIRGTNEILNEILPFRIVGTQLEQELPVKVLLPFSVLFPAEDYAPISKITRIIGINPQTTLIAQAGDIPLIGYRQVNSGAIFQINIPDLGVWHFAQLNLNHRDILNPLLEEIVRFLSPYGRSERLILESPKRQYQIGEKISFYLKSYNRNLMPGSGGDFYLEFRQKKFPFFEIRPGIYEVTFYAETPGEFAVFAQGNFHDDTLRSNQLKFNIVEINSESEEIINEQLLEEIAQKSNGGYYNLSQLKNFEPPQVKENYENKNFPFDQPFFYIFIFCLLVLDWIIRKKGGLI